MSRIGLQILLYHSNCRYNHLNPLTLIHTRFFSLPTKQELNVSNHLSIGHQTLRYFYDGKRWCIRIGDPLMAFDWWDNEIDILIGVQDMYYRMVITRFNGEYIETSRTSIEVWSSVDTLANQIMDKSQWDQIGLMLSNLFRQKEFIRNWITKLVTSQD